jgi:hypothetical protein
MERTVFKVVSVEPGISKGAETLHSACIWDSPYRRVYVPGVRTYPPEGQPYAKLFAFSEKGYAIDFAIDVGGIDASRVSGGLQVWEATTTYAVPATIASWRFRDVYAFWDVLNTTKDILGLWEHNMVTDTPPGTLFCDDITLIRNIRNV